jgi:hypothetical protein
MNFKKHLIQFPVFLIIALYSFNSAAQSMIFSTTYDKKKDQTVQVMLPHGNIGIPGQWEKTSYNQVSKQHFFKNGDSTILSVSKNPANKYPFFKAAFSDQQLVSEFVKWDSEYWQQQGLTIKVLKDESEKGFIVWQAKADKAYATNTIFVFGCKKGFVYGFSATSKSWSEEKMQEFLTELFKSNS